MELCLDWGLSTGSARFEKKPEYLVGGKEGRKEKGRGECRKGGTERERKGKKHRGRTEGGKKERGRILDPAAPSLGSFLSKRRERSGSQGLNRRPVLGVNQ